MKRKTNLPDIDLAAVKEEAKREARPKLLQATTELVQLLVIRKKLPHFYFVDAAALAEISPHTCRQWKVSTWPLTRELDQNRLYKIYEILLKVYLRLIYYPASETYPQAIERLKVRIIYLKAFGLTHNQIAIQAGVSHKTLADILDKPPEEAHRNRRCPWELLEKLSTAEDTAKQRKENRIQASHYWLRGENQEEEILKPPPPEATINPGDNCTKCSMPWSHLHEDGQDAWGNTIMTCRTCGKNNTLASHPAGPAIKEMENAIRGAD